MAKSFELENKIKDIKAHYNVVKGELDSTIQAINDAIELKESYLLEIDNLSDEIKTKQSQLLGVRRELERAEEDKKQAQRETIKAIDKRIDLEETYGGFVDELQKTVESLDYDIKSLKKQKKNEEIDLSQTIQSLDTKIKEKNTLIQSSEKTLGKLKTEIIQLEKDKVNKKEEIDSVFKTLQEYESELHERTETINEREKELREIAESYTTRFKKLEQREADVDVIVRRITKKYEELYPGRKLTI